MTTTIRRTSRSRLARTAAAFAALSLVAAACGDDDEDGGDATAEDTAADTAADTAEATASADVSAEEPVATTAAPDATEPTTATEEPVATTAAPAECDTPDPVKLQLQWFIQAQFAGYYAAADQGYFEAMCLDVELIEGGVEIQPHVVLANGDSDFATTWVPKALAVREGGGNIVNIAQIYQRSGTLQVSFADAGISSPADFAGKNIGNWGFGNEYEVFAALGEAGLDPASDVTLVGQNFDMIALLEGSIDAAEAMTYNEYAQVLEAVNPDTGELYTPEDFSVINYEDVGVGMLQDSIWADGERLANDPEYRDVAVRLVAASMQGWTYCRDNAEACAEIVLAAGPTLGASHQLWQMNEVNKLIWPSTNGIGFIDQAAWDRTVEISLSTPNLEGTTVLTAPPTEGAYTNEIVEAAWALLDGMGLDLFGEGYAPIDVTLNEGGA